MNDCRSAWRHVVWRLMIPLVQKYSALLAQAIGEPGAVEGMRICFEVLSLAAAIHHDRGRRLGAHDLSEGKFVLLFLLARAEEGLSPHELAEQGGVTRGTVTGLLDGLERSGLVRRISHDRDRRKLTVRLTAEGAALTCRLTGEHGRWIGSLLSDLSETERETLRHLLAKAFARTDAGAHDAVAHDGRGREPPRRDRGRPCRDAHPRGGAGGRCRHAAAARGPGEGRHPRGRCPAARRARHLDAHDREWAP